MTQSATHSASDSPLPSPKERRRRREAMSMTEQEVAAAVGVTKATVRAWETGRSEPRGRRREAYAKLLGATAPAPAPAPVRAKPSAKGVPSAEPEPGNSEDGPTPGSDISEDAPTPEPDRPKKPPTSETDRSEDAPTTASGPVLRPAAAPSPPPATASAPASAPTPEPASARTPEPTAAPSPAPTAATAPERAQPPRTKQPHSTTRPVSAVKRAAKRAAGPASPHRTKAAPPLVHTHTAAQQERAASRGPVEPSGPQGAPTPVRAAERPERPEPSVPSKPPEPPASAGPSAEPSAGPVDSAVADPTPPGDQQPPGHQRPPEPPGSAGLTPAEAFDALYTYAAPGLVRQAYLLTGRRRLSHDSVERAFHLAWQQWPEVARDRDPVGWVRAAAYEFAMSPWQRLRPVHRHPDTPPLDRERRELLDALLELPPPYRRTLVLYDGLGLDLPETAAETEASTPAAANRVLHAREAIAERLPHLDSPEALHQQLTALADACPVPQPAPAHSVRRAGERRIWFWTRTALAVTALIAGATSFTLATAPTHHESEVAPGRPVAGIPAHAGPGPLTEHHKELRERLLSEPVHGPERLVPRIP
ncbi:helix-turn-helix domain-containing protein [Streptomyces sp. NPDC055078]